MELLRLRHCTKGRMMISDKVIYNYNEDLITHRKLTENDCIIGPLFMRASDRKRNNSIKDTSD